MTTLPGATHSGCDNMTASALVGLLLRSAAAPALDHALRQPAPSTPGLHVSTPEGWIARGGRVAPFPAALYSSVLHSFSLAFRRTKAHAPCHEREASPTTHLSFAAGAEAALRGQASDGGSHAAPGGPAWVDLLPGRTSVTASGSIAPSGGMPTSSLPPRPAPTRSNSRGSLPGGFGTLPDLDSQQQQQQQQHQRSSAAPAPSEAELNKAYCGSVQVGWVLKARDGRAVCVLAVCVWICIWSDASAGPEPQLPGAWGTQQAGAAAPQRRAASCARVHMCPPHPTRLSRTTWRPPSSRPTTSWVRRLWPSSRVVLATHAARGAVASVAAPAAATTGLDLLCGPCCVVACHAGHGLPHQVALDLQALMHAVSKVSTTRGAACGFSDPARAVRAPTLR